LSYDDYESVTKYKESVVRDYFYKLQNGDIVGLLNMFSDNAVIHEPFSKLKSLRGRSEIESFLKTVIMVNSGMHQELKIERSEHETSKNQIVVTAIFHKGNSIKCRFIFELDGYKEMDRGMIQSLAIHFID
jgi:ketosteroid isomerase-like protein